MLIKKQLLITIWLTGIFSLGTSMAAPNYISLSVGQSSVDTGISGLTGSASLDEEDTSFKLIIGKDVSPTLSIEGFYQDFGEASLTGNAGDQFTAEGTTLAFIVDNGSIKSSATAFGASAIFKHKIGTNSSLYGKLGVAIWDSEFKVSGSGIGTFEDSETGADPFFGFGVNVGLTNKFSLAADFELYKIDDDDIDMLSLYAIYHF